MSAPATGHWSHAQSRPTWAVVDQEARTLSITIPLYASTIPFPITDAEVEPRKITTSVVHFPTHPMARMELFVRTVEELRANGVRTGSTEHSLVVWEATRELLSYGPAVRAAIDAYAKAATRRNLSQKQPEPVKMLVSKCVMDAAIKWAA